MAVVEAPSVAIRLRDEVLHVMLGVDGEDDARVSAGLAFCARRRLVSGPLWDECGREVLLKWWRDWRTSARNHPDPALEDLREARKPSTAELQRQHPVRRLVHPAEAMFEVVVDAESGERRRVVVADATRIELALFSAARRRQAAGFERSASFYDLLARELKGSQRVKSIPVDRFWELRVEAGLSGGDPE